jgi:hypothetical protein
MKTEISRNVDKWMEEETHQRVLALRIITKNDPWYGMTEEEIEDRREFIRCYLLKDFEQLFMIPSPPREKDFWFQGYQEFIESAFNTYDFQRTQRPFDRYGYKVRKVMKQVKDLALLHSCISESEGRERTKARFEELVDSEFRDQLLSLVDRYKRTFDEERRFELRRKIARLSGHILECKTIWEKYSPWRTYPPHHLSLDSVQDGQTSSTKCGIKGKGGR